MSKKLVIKVPAGLVKTTAVPREKIPEHRKGWFNVDPKQDDDGETITVTFTTVLLVDEKLSKEELAPIIKHERDHEVDFHRLAAQFKKSLEAAYKKNNDQDFEAWLDWFTYDTNEASIAYHRRHDVIDLTQNHKPTSPRPK
jgi:hypothetical protein